MVIRYYLLTPSLREIHKESTTLLRYVYIRSYLASHGPRVHFWREVGTHVAFDMLMGSNYGRRVETGISFGDGVPTSIPIRMEILSDSYMLCLGCDTFYEVFVFHGRSRRERSAESVFRRGWKGARVSAASPENAPGNALSLSMSVCVCLLGAQPGLAATEESVQA